MTRHELIELAQECGIDINANDTFSTSRESQYWVEAGYFDIERFATLVAAAEREACANIALNTQHIDEYDNPTVAIYRAIRARSNT